MATILVIEDNEPLREEVADILRFEDYEVIEAENGRAGLEAIEQRTPDLVLSDLMMPEMDGYETLRRLRARPEWATIPFLCLTALAERADMRKAMEDGADDYVIKPFKAEELIAAVQAGLEKKARAAHDAEKKLTELRESITRALPHELRTPLSVIVGYAEILADPSSSEETSQAVRTHGESILLAARRLHRLMENFLLYAQLELLRKDPKSCPPPLLRAVSLDEVAARVTRQRAREARREDDLALEIEPVAVPVEAHSLGKIVEELADNAFKFSKPGTPARVKVGRGAIGAVLSISDRGQGMTQDQIAATQAYIQFNRVMNEQQGMGLGLSIARQLVSLYGGSLSVESQPGEGTTVSVLLPTAQPADLDCEHPAAAP